jgi:hypothetical protein
VPNTNPIFLSDHHTPRRTDARWSILQKILGAIIDGGIGGGGGAGAINTTGLNYCFQGTSPNQTFKLINATTGLANEVGTLNADPDQTILIQNGSAC